MNIDKEFQSYIKFVKTHYPKSSMGSEEQLSKFKKIITTNLKAIKLLNTYYEIDCLSEGTRLLINDLKFYYLRFLYILPTNDFYFANTILRTMSENILRIVYIAIVEDISYKKIITYKHRQLWKDGIKLTDSYRTYNKSLSNINRIFSNMSLTVHGSQSQYNNHIDYLVNLMENDTMISFKQLRSDVNAMFNFLYEDLFYIFKIKDENLTMQQSISLKSLA